MRCFSRRGTLGLVAALALLTTIVLPGQPTSTARAATVPGGLPAHFGFGLAAHPDSSGIDGWMPSSGVPWDYAYQYLSGGVNTGGGWEVWNAQGQFALWYAQGADAHHYIPVFPYYEMLQSSGSCNSCGEPQRDLTNLNTAGTMGSYFANFRLLMQRLSARTYNGIAGFGKTAIVQIEPDLSGYAEQAVLDNSGCYGFCTGTGNNPALLRAAVASSGDADVAAYPNTYQGFNWALLHLRDLYAPNVLLAFHVSNWATRTDIGSNTSPSVDAAALGQQAGSFAAQSGITGLPAGVKGYDLIFNDVSDRDAAYYKYVYNNPSVFWDRANVTFPNFLRWESYVRAVTSATALPVIVWQVPEGNQYFDTENNTNGHYQDNRAEYFFGHIGELVSAGIVGVLFGAGNGGSTNHTDAMGDGTTNPAGFCTHDGLSSGQICNNHTSTVADDDGGYIRAQGRQYYAGGGYPLGGATATPTATPQPPTASATRTPTASPSATASRVPSATVTRTATSTSTAVPSRGSLTGSGAVPSGPINLTSQGTLDWAHWGHTSTSSFEHKAGVAQQISNYSLPNGGATGHYALYPSGYTWSDGTPIAGATSVYGVYITGQGHAFKLTMPADNLTTRTLRLYVGQYQVQAKITAALSDGSAAPYSDTFNIGLKASARYYTINYRAGSPGQTLTIVYTLTADNAAGNIQLHAATLS